MNGIDQLVMQALLLIDKNVIEAFNLLGRVLSPIFFALKLLTPCIGRKFFVNDEVSNYILWRKRYL